MLYLKITFLLVQKLFFRKEDAVNHFLGERKLKNDNKKNKNAKNIKTETGNKRKTGKRNTSGQNVKEVNILCWVLEQRN
jgi:hypothetical protein